MTADELLEEIALANEPKIIYISNIYPKGVFYENCKNFPERSKPGC